MAQAAECVVGVLVECEAEEEEGDTRPLQAGHLTDSEGRSGVSERVAL